MDTCWRSDSRAVPATGLIRLEVYLLSAPAQHPGAARTLWTKP